MRGENEVDCSTVLLVLTTSLRRSLSPLPSARRARTPVCRSPHPLPRSAAGALFCHHGRGQWRGGPERPQGEDLRAGVREHTGFGLFFAREILAITGITIRETGTPGEGARFEMVVPEGGTGGMRKRQDKGKRKRLRIYFSQNINNNKN